MWQRGVCVHTMAIVLTEVDWFGFYVCMYLCMYVCATVLNV